MRKIKPIVIIIAVFLLALLSYAAVCFYKWELRHETTFFGLNLGMSKTEVKEILDNDVYDINMDFENLRKNDDSPIFTDAKYYMLKDDFPLLTYTGKLLLMFDETDALCGLFFCPENYVWTPECGNALIEYFDGLYGNGSRYSLGQSHFSQDKGWEKIFSREDNGRIEYSVNNNEHMIIFMVYDKEMFVILCDSDEITKGAIVNYDYSVWKNDLQQNEDSSIWQ